MTTKKFRKLIAQAFLLAMFMSLSIGAIAADIRPIIYGSYRALVIEGTIESGDFEKFVKMIRDNQGQISTVYIFSPGGDFYEAMKIGGAMRALELATMVPMRDPSGRPSCGGIGGFLPKPNDPKNCTCASACFFIHIGGVHRSGTFIAVHRPYFEKGNFGKLSEVEAKKAFEALQDSARVYMLSMGVPEHIQEDVLGTASDRALILDEKTVKTYFLGELPYRHEWIKNKCSRLSDEETGRVEGYTQRFLRARPSSESGLSKEEWSDLETLQKKQKEELNCAVSINQQGRIDAYEKFFGVKPSDYANHNFSKWSETSKYLGRSFDDILSEKKFEEEKSTMFAGKYLMTTLSRAATANLPAVNLYDTRWKKRVVTSVGLVSTPNPSQEFIQRLVKSLDDVWGKHTGGNGSSEWLWNKDGFTAKLVLDPVSAEGPFLHLSIDEK